MQNMPRKNVDCDQCSKKIRGEELAWFSDIEKDLDLCSKECKLAWEKRSAKKYLDNHFPKTKRAYVKELRIPGTDKPITEKLTGSLDLSDFVRLMVLDCQDHHITELIINSPHLTDLNCCKNKISSLKSLNCPQLKTLIFHHNPIADVDYFLALDHRYLTEFYPDEKISMAELTKFRTADEKREDIYTSVPQRNVELLQSLQDRERRIEKMKQHLLTNGKKIDKKNREELDTLEKETKKGIEICRWVTTYDLLFRWQKNFFSLTKLELRRRTFLLYLLRRKREDAGETFLPNEIIRKIMDYYHCSSKLIERVSTSELAFFHEVFQARIEQK